jgi:hypothetical protein
MNNIGTIAETFVRDILFLLLWAGQEYFRSLHWSPVVPDTARLPLCRSLAMGFRF